MSTGKRESVAVSENFFIQQAKVFKFHQHRFPAPLLLVIKRLFLPGSVSFTFNLKRTLKNIHAGLHLITLTTRRPS